MKPAFLTRLVCLFALFAFLSAGASAQPAYRYELLNPPQFGATDGIQIAFLSATIGLNDDGTLLAVWPDYDTGMWSYHILRQNGEHIPILLPDSPSVIVGDINNRRTIVGYYWTLDDRAYGFYRNSQGLTTTYAYPGALHTGFVGISDSGLALGFVYTSETDFSQFLLRMDGTVQHLSFLDYDPARFSFFDLNNSGTLIGYYFDDFFNAQAVVARGSEVSEIIIPEAQGVNPTRINNRGEVIGYYGTTSSNLYGFALHGFVRDPSGRITTLYDPTPWPETITVPYPLFGLSLDCTYVEYFGSDVGGINDRGQISGMSSAIYLTQFGWPIRLGRHFLATPIGPDNH